MIQAIGFDIDGTLYPAHALFCRLLPGALYRLPLLLAFNAVRKEIRQPDFYARHGLSVPHNVAEFHAMQAELSARKLQAHRASASKQRSPSGDPSSSVAYIMEEIEAFFYRRQEEQFDHVRLFPAVRSSLEQLRADGFKLGALSDFPADNKLQRLRLDTLFDVIMTSEACGYVKPHRASFDRLAAELDTEASKILYVGNSEHYDVAGAKAAGMQTALISRNRKQSQADLVFRNYPELLAWIARNRS